MKHTILALALGLASTTAFADSYYKYEDVESKTISSDKQLEFKASLGKSEIFEDLNGGLESKDLELGFKFVDANNVIYKLDADYKELKDLDDVNTLNVSAALGYNYEVGSSDIGIYGGVYAFEAEKASVEEYDQKDFFVGVSADIPLLDDDVSLDLYAEHYNDIDDTEVLDNLRYGADLSFKVTSNLDAFVGLESFGHVETMKAGVALKF